jgi:outer membrane biosynthesis protein TonB
MRQTKEESPSKKFFLKMWADVAFFIFFILLLIALYALWKSWKSEQESSRTTMVSSLLESQVEGSATLTTPQQILSAQPVQEVVQVQETTTEGPQSV